MKVYVLYCPSGAMSLPESMSSNKKKLEDEIQSYPKALQSKLWIEEYDFSKEDFFELFKE